MPLWITRTRSAGTPYSSCTSRFIARDTATTPSAFSYAVRSTHDEAW
jgi:hypothetical protein